MISGKIYISAKRGADVTGYTRDYIGQLCRAKKVEATMIGKTWFVSEDSLSTHKLVQEQAQGQTSGLTHSLSTAPTVSMAVHNVPSIEVATMIAYTRPAPVFFQWVVPTCLIIASFGGYAVHSDVLKNMFARIDSQATSRVVLAAVSDTNIFVKEVSQNVRSRFSAQMATVSKGLTTGVANTVVDLRHVSENMIATIADTSKNISDATVGTITETKEIVAIVTEGMRTEISEAVRIGTAQTLSAAETLTLSVVDRHLNRTEEIIAATDEVKNSFNIVHASLSPLSQNVSVGLAAVSTSVSTTISAAASSVAHVLSDSPSVAVAYSRAGLEGIFIPAAAPTPVTASKSGALGIAVMPNTDGSTEAIKRQIRESFSDEVSVTPDASGTAGIIKPVFKHVSGDEYVYVLVPISK